MTDAPLRPEPEPAPPRRRGVKRRFLSRWTKRLLALGAALIATIFLLLFTIDLGRLTIGGRSLRSLAEAQGSRFLEQPLTIGRIGATLRPGKFEISDVVIHGKTPQDQPFFKARRIAIEVPWWRILSENRIVVEVQLFDWAMVVESWAGGRNNIPRLTPRTQRPPGPKKYTTTVNFVYGHNGQFSYFDYATPWSVVGRNLGFSFVRAENLKRYVGTAMFTNGTVQIQQYRPMRADFKTRFWLDEATGLVRLDHIDLQTDGAATHVNGYVNFRNWPEQTYNVSSRIDFPTMRQIFFANEKWRLGGEGEFNGVFKLFKNAPISRELKGEFRSHEMRVDIGETSWTFDELHGALEWLPSRFAVTHADSEFLGGTMRLDYALEPLGRPGGARATFSADYENVDLHQFTRRWDWTSLLPQGRMSGSVAMSWPNGRFGAGMEGDGHTRIAPTGAVASQTLADAGPAPIDPGPFDEFQPYGQFPFAGEMRYRFTSSTLDFEPGSWAATPETYIAFNGRAFGTPVHLPFTVTSHDWQGSDRLFTAIMGEFTDPTSAIQVGGRGTFTGVLTESFRSPRIEGAFASEAMRAWNVTWGRATGDIVIQNGFLDIRNGAIRGDAPGAVIRTDGRYSLGYKPGQEEMNATVRIEHWPLEDLKLPFELTDWPIDGTAGLIALKLSGPYRELVGGGQMRIDNAVAWGEPFDRATGDLLFEGDGLRINRIEMTKGPGRVLGNAWIGWAQGALPARYSFTASGERIPIESLKRFQVPQAPLTGTMQFTVSGAAPFAAPVYEFDGRIIDLYAGDEGIGQVRAHLTVRDNILTIDRLDAASPRLQVFGSGSIAMNDAYDSQLFFRFTDSSLDPYIKFLAPGLSPYARAIISGSVNVNGPLSTPTDLVVTANIAEATVTLVNYDLKNDAPMTIVFEENSIKIPRIGLVGTDTKLDLSGEVNIGANRAKIDANGQASLAILQLFYPDLIAVGGATLNATLEGPLDAEKIALTGKAQITDGRLRPYAFPQGLSDINGPITINAQEIRIDGLRGVIGGGTIQFRGRIPLVGYRPESFDLRAESQALQLRYPADVRSTVRLNLAMTGPIVRPRLSGTVDVLRATYAPRADGEGGLLAFATGGGAGPAAPPPVTQEPGVPIALDVVVRALQPIAFISNDDAEIIGTARFDVNGTIAQPEITGGIDIRRGEWSFGGNRYVVRRGSLRFDNPKSLDPFFDVEATTRVRAPGQTFDITLGATGTFDKFTHTINSEPWLPDYQILTLLFGETPDIGSAELQARGSSQQMQQRAFQQTMAVLLTSPLSSRIGDVFERIAPIDTINLIPLVGTETSLQQFNPSARIVLGKRISERVYLTYSRTFNASQYEVILLEYDQNDRISWVLSRNEDRSFSLDFRIRYVF